jgi:hypothetical protein
VDTFWRAIEEQCQELRSAKTAAEVIAILNRPGSPSEPSSGDAFFAGSGGDTQLDDCLHEAGWSYAWREASYYWAMRAPDGSLLTYVEGDVYLGDTIPRS